LSPHPRVDYMVACGSYDETLCLYDTRYFKPLCQTPKLGGGIWQLKWHPYTNRRLLVAAMHGGCSVLNMKGFESYCRNNGEDLETDVMFPRLSPSSSSLSSASNMYGKVTKRFEEHKSMTYGADWLVCRHPMHTKSYFEAAASCSFYDRATFLWDSVF
jgi:diphthamide biosynthesis protein 7